MTKGDYITKYGEKDGLRRWKRNECTRRWRAANKGKVNKYKRQWQAEHKEKKAEYDRRYQAEHREQVNECNRRYRESHPDKVKEATQRWKETNPMQVRAGQLLRNYRRNDRLQNRGDCTLSKQWILENIFNRSCLYCGESDWRLLGCDRKNNSKPHTIENVVCCCGKCNDKRSTKDFLDFAYSMGAKDSEGLIIR